MEEYKGEYRIHQDEEDKKSEECEKESSNQQTNELSDMSMDKKQELSDMKTDNKYEYYEMPSSYIREKNLIYTDQFKDKLTLSPLKKYSKYGKFPFKLMIHIGLILFTTIQIQYSHSDFTPFSIEQEEQWSQVFYENKDRDPKNGIYQFLIMEDLQAHFKQIFANIREFNGKYYQQIDLSQAEVYFQYYPLTFEKKDVFINFQKEPIDIAIGIKKPFDQDNEKSIKLFLSQTLEFIIHFKNIQVYSRKEIQPFTCWHFSILYSFVSNTYIHSHLQTKGKICDDYQPNSYNFSATPLSIFQGSQIFVNIVVLLLALGSTFLGFKYIFDMIEDFMRFKEKGQILVSSLKKQSKNDENGLVHILTEQRSWDQLSFSEKMKFFDLWFIIILCGNFCQISTSLSIILNNNQDYLNQRLEGTLNWQQGLGCALAWLTALKYFDYFSKFNITSELIKRSFPKIGKNLLGFIPILASFVILGMALFGQSERFGSMRDSLATLFSLLLGDSIFDITMDIQDYEVPQSLAILYITSFIVLFIYSMNNVMVAIISEEGVKRRKRLRKDQAERKIHKEKIKLEMARKAEEKRLQIKFLNNKNNIQSDELESLSQQRESDVSNDSNNNSAFQEKEKCMDSINTNQNFKQDIKINSALLKKERKNELDQNQFINQQFELNQFEQEASFPLSPTQIHNQSPKTQSLQNQQRFSHSQMNLSGQQPQSPLIRELHPKKDENVIEKSIQSQISRKALTKIAIQMKKGHQGDSDHISLRDKFNKEVELLTEQKLHYQKFNKLFKKGFHQVMNILDKQAYELKDNIYLYRLSKHDHCDIYKRFCDILTYLLIRTKA